MPDKIIFLDIDEVLYTHTHTAHGPNTNSVNLFKEVLQTHPGIKLVLVSVWVQYPYSARTNFIHNTDHPLHFLVPYLHQEYSIYTKDIAPRGILVDRWISRHADKDTLIAVVDDSVGEYTDSKIAHRVVPCTANGLQFTEYALLHELLVNPLATNTTYLRFAQWQRTAHLLLLDPDGRDHLYDPTEITQLPDAKFTLYSREGQKEALLLMMEDQAYITSHTVMAYFNCKRSKANNILKALVDEGRVVMHRAGTRVRYSLP